MDGAGARTTPPTPARILQSFCVTFSVRHAKHVGAEEGDRWVASAVHDWLVVSFAHVPVNSWIHQWIYKLWLVI